MTVPAERIVAAARTYKGTPFRHQGRRTKPGMATGLDCLGLWLAALWDAGIDVPDCRDYGRMPDIKRLFRETGRHAIRLPLDCPLRPGLMAIFHDPEWVHVGIMTGPDSFIHSRGPEWLKVGVVEHILDRQSWGNRLRALWRHPQMEWTD